MKRKLQHSEASSLHQPAVKKQLRSKLPRRKRSYISPIILPSFSISNSSHLTSEISRDSSKSNSVNKREIEGENEFRRVTRAYFRKNNNQKKNKDDADVELSECSCVDSCTSQFIGKITKNEDPVEIEDSDAISTLVKVSSDFCDKISKSESDVVEGTAIINDEVIHISTEFTKRNAKVIEETEDSDAISTFLKASSDFSSKISKSVVEGTAKIDDDDVVSFNSVLQSPSESKCGNLSVQAIKCTENRAIEEDMESEVSKLSAATHAHDKLNGSAAFDLECSENFSIKCSENRAIEEDIESKASLIELSAATQAHDKLNGSAEFDLECSEQGQNRAIEEEINSKVSQLTAATQAHDKLNGDAEFDLESSEQGENRATEEEINSEQVSKLSGATHAQDKLDADAEFDLECSENFSIIDVSDDYYSSAYSDIFPDSSDIDLSDYSPSYWYESGSQFSEKSNVDATPSPTFTLFLWFSQQFCRSTVALQSTHVNSSEDHVSTEFTGLENEEDEESYRMIRNREKRQLYLHDYAEEYCSTTHYGDLIVQQRLQMVHWILEQATRKDLQKETMFLSVNLFDRFLSKGYFRTKRCLQIAGIACLTLAVRIEENQPFNSIRQKTFVVAGTAYSCSEVVAMEWLVQEVLNFQCFLPTIYNFLWFYLKAARAAEHVERTTKYLAVLALLGHEHLCYRPSTVASALVILALSAANLYASCHLVTKTHAKIKDEDLPECIKSLEWLVKYI
ncbi:cyclin-SDS [Lycium barbarum]|uniref:cyclin-SDS n=1 Tax=Lycium barbarum TaxID=112863 RepID=UPI00293E5AE8|nr:cyclin-SDS [Lycium barbarum]XP_060186611.1 cyclin-SDS [Lycium barbarum]